MKNTFQEHHDDIAKKCKRLLTETTQEQLAFVHDDYENGRLDGRREMLQEVIEMLECDYPSELYKQWPEYLGSQYRRKKYTNELLKCKTGGTPNPLKLRTVMTLIYGKATMRVTRQRKK